MFRIIAPVLMVVLSGCGTLNTAYSLDAYIFGTTMNDPFTAYRFAKGEEVTLPTGVKKRIKAPLDFTAVTDHSETLGEYEICTNPEMAGYTSATCEGIRASQMQIFQEIFAGMYNSPAKRVEEICGEDGAPEGQGGMMHRNVIFRSDTVPGTVYAAFEGTGEQLHAWLETKGWKTASGELKEQTYDIACSDNGKPDPETHRCADNGAQVNLDTCMISTD